MIAAISLNPHLLDDAPAYEIAQDHADRTRREMQERAQLVGREGNRRQIGDRPYAAHVALEAPELDEAADDVAHQSFARPQRIPLTGADRGRFGLRARSGHVSRTVGR